MQRRLLPQRQHAQRLPRLRACLNQFPRASITQSIIKSETESKGTELQIITSATLLKQVLPYKHSDFGVVQPD